MSNTYFSFASMAAIAVTCIYFSVPETKGKTLEQIEAMWASRTANKSEEA